MNGWELREKESRGRKPINLECLAGAMSCRALEATQGVRFHSKKMKII